MNQNLSSPFSRWSRPVDHAAHEQTAAPLTRTTSHPAIRRCTCFISHLRAVGLLKKLLDLTKSTEISGRRRTLNDESGRMASFVSVQFWRISKPSIGFAVKRRRCGLFSPFSVGKLNESGTKFGAFFSARPDAMVLTCCTVRGLR